MFIVGSNDCVIDGNNFSMIDTVIPAGTSNYLYGINIGYNKNLMISNNDFKMSTAGGKDAAGTAYAIQGVECEVSMIGNNITSISNGPNLGIYFASMTGGTSELYIANNLINVTGLASASGSWALVSGIEVQNGNAKYTTTQSTLTTWVIIVLKIICMVSVMLNTCTETVHLIYVTTEYTLTAIMQFHLLM